MRTESNTIVFFKNKNPKYSFISINVWFRTIFFKNFIPVSFEINSVTYLSTTTCQKHTCGSSCYKFSMSTAVVPPFDEVVQESYSYYRLTELLRWGRKVRIDNSFLRFVNHKVAVTILGLREVVWTVTVILSLGCWSGLDNLNLGSACLLF